MQDWKSDVGVEQAVTGAQLNLTCFVEPATFSVDLDLSQLVTGAPNPIGDCGAADQRDFPLRGAPPEITATIIGAYSASERHLQEAA